MGGHTYRIPGSPPMEWYLWQRQFLARITENPVGDSDIDDAYQKVLELVNIRQPQAKGLPGVTPEHCFQFIVSAYGAQTDGDAVPPRRTRGGTVPGKSGARRSSR